VDDFIALTKDKPVDVRFIELMPIGSLGQNDSLRVSSDELLAPRPYLKPVPPKDAHQVSTDYAIAGHIGHVGFISPVSHKFCGSCNRIRIMSDGTLRPCLGNNLEIPLKVHLKEDDATLIEVIRQAIFHKPVGHHFEQGFISEKNMNEIGG
jgi:cyclic pyranopterin phosphate synthase